jgi:hypothetical protein
MRRIAATILALGMVLAPALSAANDKDGDKKSTDSTKAAPNDTGKTDNKPATSAPSNAEVMAELEQMRALLKEQADQIAQQQHQIAAMQSRLDGSSVVVASVSTPAASPAPATSSVPTTSVASVPASSNVILTAADAPANPAAAAAAPRQEQKESPLSFKIGGAEFTPGGFVDFQNIFRSTNASNGSSIFSQDNGNSIGTNFGVIPFSNTVAGHLTEYRATAQTSRVSLKVTDKFGLNDVTGYIEADFNGNDSLNTYVGTNDHTLGLRLYWLDLKRGKWEFLGGQSWGMLTPNYVGLSPMPSDLALTMNEDAHYQVGLPLTRAAQFRAAYHFNDHWVWGASIENPQQYTGFNETVFPFAFNAQLNTQFDANNNPQTPNVAPDVISKMAYDTDMNGRHFHVEAGGLMTTVKVTVLPTAGPTFVSHSKIGGGVEGAFNFDLTKNFRLVANGMYGNGIGRYLLGLGPQAVMVPIQTGVGQFDARPSLVHAATGSVGIETQVHSKTQFGFYYGAVYFERNTFVDVTSPLLTQPFIGFGGVNSSNSANRAIQEGTIDWTQTLWGSESHGKLQLVTQGSYLTRAPWFVAAGAPKNAHLFMSFVSLRYVLP